MTKIKSLILGSAAGLLAIGGAQAADLPVKAKAVEYVKVCSLYGAGFYYIPGTDTCIKIGGYLRVDTSFNASAVYGTPQFGGAGLSNTRSKDYFVGRVRANLNMDTRTATEYGVLRTYMSSQFQWSDNADSIAGGNMEVDYVFIQFAGFQFGKAVSMFDTQWVLAQPTISSGFTGGSDDKTGIPQLAYTASFGNGVSASISAETPRPYRRGGVYSTADSFTASVPGVTAPTDRSAGDMMPDFVANLRLDQAWGSLHFAGAVHQVAMQYNTPDYSTSGSQDDKYGYAFIGGFELKNLPTGAGDSLRGDITYAKGASRYVFGGTSNVSGSGFGIVNGNGIAFGNYTDAVYNPRTGLDLQLSTTIGARLFYEHYWNPAWRTSLWGVYARHEQTNDGQAALLNMYNAAYGGHLTGSPNFTVYQVGSRTAWTPVKDLTISAEVSWVSLETGLNGTVDASTWSNRKGQILNVGDQNSVVGQVQILRSF